MSSIPVITVTDAAIARIEQIIVAENNLNLKLRIAVDGGGCSGFQYIYELTEIVEPDDMVIEHNKVTLLIDSVSKEFITGSVLDFVKELGSSYFQIKNPKASTRCGCGNSFAV